VYAAVTQWIDAPRAAPAGTALFAVGDVHGHADELQAMQYLLDDAGAQAGAERVVVVYLGDYVDRGPAIARTLELLVSDAERRDGVERVYLAGNHDQYLIGLLAGDPAVDRGLMAVWYANGGRDTMKDLAVEGYGRLAIGGSLGLLAERTAEALGPRTLAFLRRLELTHREGDYLFVHAGIDPAVPLEDQDPYDLLMIREPFLASPAGWPHPFCVVHGHSIGVPAVRPHRIGVDAGCYTYGALCAVQILGSRVRCWGVTGRADFDWQGMLGGGDHPWVWSAVSSACSPSATSRAPGASPR